MTIDQSLQEVADSGDVLARLIDLLPIEDQAGLAEGGDDYGDVVMAIGDLAVLQIDVPSELVSAVKAAYPDDGADLDDLLYERIGRLRIAG